MEDPYFQSLLADASLEAADVDGGLAAVEEGLRVARRERIVFCDPELLRLRAGLLRAGGAPADDVIAELERAIALAREQRSRVLELRAAVDLASLRWEAGAPADARRVVAEVYERFHEGFATPDLREAAAILRAPTVPPAATP
jgi:adenylate cyclase